MGRLQTVHFAMPSVNSRNNDTIYLLGHYESNITGSKLPSVKQVLRVLFFNIRVVKLNLRKSATLSTQKAIIFWEKNGFQLEIPILI